MVLSVLCIIFCLPVFFYCLILVLLFYEVLFTKKTACLYSLLILCCEVLRWSAWGADWEDWGPRVWLGRELALPRRQHQMQEYVVFPLGSYFSREVTFILFPGGEVPTSIWGHSCSWPQVEVFTYREKFSLLLSNYTSYENHILWITSPPTLGN